MDPHIKPLDLDALDKFSELWVEAEKAAVFDPTTLEAVLEDAPVQVRHALRSRIAFERIAQGESDYRKPNQLTVRETLLAVIGFLFERGKLWAKRKLVSRRR